MSWDNLINSVPVGNTEDPGSAVQTIDGKQVDSPLRNVDADTLALGDQRYRLAGMNAPETVKVKGGVFIPAQVAGDTTQADVNRLAKAGGFTEGVTTGAKDVYGRKILEQRNSAGQNIGDVATALGITDITNRSSDEAIRGRNMVDALSRLMPGLGASDPMIKISREAYEKKVEQQGGNPLFIPKAQVESEAQYAAIKNAVGVKALSAAFKEIDRIEGLLADPSHSPETRVKLNKMLEKARDDAFIAGTIPDFVGVVGERKDDRTIMNKAYNQLGTTWENAILDIKKQTYGFLELAGEQLKWDWLKDSGKTGVVQQQVAQGRLPETLNSFREVPGSDSWETITNAATYAGNLVAGTLPMMSIIMASALAAPAGVAGVAASLVPSSLLYTGGYYADQPDDKKNPALAWGAGIGSAVLDRAGLEGMVGPNLFSAIGRKEILEKMATLPQYKGMAPAQLEEALKGMTKSAIVEMSEAGAKFATQQYASRQAMLEGLKQVGFAGIAESSTESAQQLLEMVAKTGVIDPDQRYEKGFYDALVDAAVGGGLMGVGFHSVGTAMEAAQWGSAANAKKIYEDKVSEGMAYRSHQRALQQTNGARPNTVEGATSVMDAIQKLRDITMPTAERPDLNSLGGQPGYWNGFRSVVRDPISFFRGLGETTVKSLRKQNGEFKTYLPVLKSMMVTGVLLGDAFDGFRQRIIGELHTPDIDQVAAQLKTSTAKVNHLLRDAWQNTWSKKGRLDESDPQNAVLQRWKDHADGAIEKAKALLTGLHYDTSNITADDSAFVDAAIDFKHIRANETRIIEELNKEGVETRVARSAIEDLTSGDPIRMAAAKDLFRRANVFSNPKLNDLFEPNIMGAFENYKHHLSNKVASDLYLGEGGSNIAKLIILAKENGEFANDVEYNTVVQNAKDWYEITQGSFRSLEKYPNIEKIVGWGVTATMLASLGKAAFSSIPEIAMSTLGTPGNKVHEQLRDAAAKLVEEIRNDVNKGMSHTVSRLGIAYGRNTPHAKAAREWENIQKLHLEVSSNPNATEEDYAADARRIKKFHKKYMGRSLFERLGYNDSGYNSQARFETNTANMKNTMRIFSAMIGLRAMTDATRIASLGVSADILNSRITELLAIPEKERFRRLSNLEDLTVGQYQAVKELESWGMDVPGVLNTISMINRADPQKLEHLMFELTMGIPVDQTEGLQKLLSDEGLVTRVGVDNLEAGLAAEVKRLEENVMLTIRNMTNERVIHPNSANLPKHYHDPRLRILTTMTRFVAAMTSITLPRLYRNYIKDGSVGMRYQAFATIAMSLFFAHFANMLKDVLSYGDDENPYLKSTAKQMQRNVYGAGILGRYESLVDAAAPLYNNKKPDPTEKPFSYAYETVKGVAPPISWADRAVRAMYNLGTGNTAQGVKQAVRSAPVIGSYPIAAEVLSKPFKE